MRYAIPVIFFCICLQLPAQQHINYTFRHIDQRDGLLHNSVLSIRQDARGFMWMLTPNGLQRYDGTRFVNYQGIVNDASRGMTYGAVLYADNRKNEIWVLKDKFMEQLTLSTNRFARYSSEEVMNNPAFHFDTYTDQSNNRFLVGDKGAFIFKPGALKPLTTILSIHPPYLHEGSIIAVDSILGQTWMIAGKQLLLLDGRTKQAFTVAHNSVNNPLLTLSGNIGTNLRMLMIDGRRNCWISTWRNKFYRFNALTGKLITYDLASIARRNPGKENEDATLLINTMYEDNHGNVWIGTENAGLLLYRAATDDFESIVVDKKNIQSIQYNFKIVCLVQDKEDNIWVGTDKGISIFNPYRQYFKSIHHEDELPSIPKNEIMDFIQAGNGDILAGTWGGGIAVYDEQWNLKKNILLPGPQDYNMAWCFVQQEDGNIWAGCQHGYIHIYNPGSGAIQTIHPPELENSTIRCMIKDSQGNIWLGLHNGKIAGWNKTSRQFFAYNGNIENEELKTASVFKIFIDKNQHFWVSTDRGFKEFDPVKRTYAHVYLPVENDSSSISATSSQGIESLNDTTLMIGTVYGGINFFNTVTKKFRHLTTANGLPSNTVYALRKDEAGYTWFTTDYNLYKFKPGNGKFIHYNMEPGMINSTFNANSFYSLRNGSWITASTTEIIAFQPTAVVQNNSSEKVEIAGFNIFNAPYFIDSLLFHQQPVRLSHQQNFFTVEFALLNFSSLEQTKYYYRLSGINKDWVNADTKNFASYTNLAPGEYTFSVKTANEKGESAPTSFTIIISPPFWQTSWFRTISLLLAASVISWLVRSRIKNIRHEAEMKQKIAETEMMALRAQMNPHFIFNCLNSIDNLIQMDEKEKATSYLAKFARLIRSILENSKNNAVPCWKDMETLELYVQLEALRFDNKFTYRIIIADEILNGDYKVPPLVIQPFVENAIHHGLLNKISGSKELLVEVTANNNRVHYLIEDNGVGRAKADGYRQLNKPMHQSMGMQITAERINLMNLDGTGSVTITDLYNEHNEACGTRVTIELINQS